MKLKIGQTRIESDFEYFVRALPALEPVEFCGLATLLGVPMVRDTELINFDREEYEKLKDTETMRAVVAESIIPVDEILEAMMDKYLSLSKRRRGEINGILKDIKRSKKNEVKKNGVTT